MSEGQVTNGADKLPAGVTIGPNGRKKYSPAFMDKAARRALDGESPKVILEELGIHSSMLRRWIQNLEARYKKKPVKQNVKRRDAGTQEEVVRRYTAGEDPEKLCKEFKIHQSTLYAWRKKLLTPAPATKGVPGGEFDPIKVRAGVGYLRHAKNAMYGALASGAIKEFDEAHLLALAALNVMLG
jgi:transposase-like protein